jgi:BirA family biotin operon repressor/biotin-[acetyl-CoA-carboxylase] ligase
MQNYENFSKKINTLFIGKDLRYLPMCQSTNLTALELIENDDYFEGTTLITDHQTAGRGQQGNTWEAEKGQNITLSVILAPRHLHSSEQFFLNMAVTLAIHDFLQSFLENPKLLKIKWSNDLLYHSQKICGILIQNIISGQYIAKSVVGIGININQKHFAEQRAISLAQITNLMYDLPVLVQKLLENLEKRYLQVQKKWFKDLEKNYYSCLYGYQEQVWIKYENEIFSGKILGVDSIGRLQMDISGEVRTFQFKEIQFLLENM